jgi:quercetin dioxygenase-like cupin family protein
MGGTVMRIVEFGADQASPIENYQSLLATSVPLADGAGECHVYCVRIAAGGSIGRHLAGFDQLFLVVEGAGWVEGGDGKREAISAGQGAFFEKGEMHAKGSDDGLVAVMVQMERMQGPQG